MLAVDVLQKWGLGDVVTTQPIVHFVSAEFGQFVNSRKWLFTQLANRIVFPPLIQRVSCAGGRVEIPYQAR